MSISEDFSEHIPLNVKVAIFQSWTKHTFRVNILNLSKSLTRGSDSTSKPNKSLPIYAHLCGAHLRNRFEWISQSLETLSLLFISFCNIQPTCWNYQSLLEFPRHTFHLVLYLYARVCELVITFYRFDLADSKLLPAFNGHSSCLKIAVWNQSVTVSQK